MIKDFSQIKIFIRPGVTDMRKAINGLAVEVQDEMSLDPFCGSLFMFCNKQRRILRGSLLGSDRVLSLAKAFGKTPFPLAGHGRRC